MSVEYNAKIYFVKEGVTCSKYRGLNTKNCFHSLARMCNFVHRARGET